MDIKFYNVEYYPVFIFAIIVGALLGYALLKRVKELNFYGALSKNPLYNFVLRERILLYKSIIFFIGFILLCIVVLRPLWGDKKSEVFEKDRDVIFILDISKSMLAKDLKPSRLEATKASIENALPYLFGARVALVSFAGSSEIRCPLTDDYEFFSETLKNCVPESALVGGSFLTAALEKTSDKLIVKDRAKKQNIIVISDGGDFITKEVDSVAKELKAKGANLTIIGIGDPVYESRIPLKDGSFLSYKDEYVKTKLENEFLKEVAFKAGGNYIETGIKSLNMEDILSTLTSSDTLKVSEDKTLDEYEDRYQVFLILAIIAFLIWAYPIGYEKKKSIFKGLIFMLSLNVYGGQGVDFYMAKDYANAEIAFTKELEQNPNDLKTLYNLAHTYYDLGEYEKSYNKYEDILAIAVEIDDIDFQDRLKYDMAVVACMHAKNLASSDVRLAHTKAKKSMDLFVDLMVNASKEEKIPNAFAYNRKIFKGLKGSLKELEDRESAREKLKAIIVKELEEQISLEELSLAHIAQKDFVEAKNSQITLMERTKALLPELEKQAKQDDSTLVDVQEFIFTMNAVYKSVGNAFKSEESTLENIVKEDATKAESYATNVLIDLNAALAMLKNSTSSLGNSDEGASGDEDFEEEDEGYDEDDDYSENYKDSNKSENEQNDGSSMLSLPSPEQLEGEILKSEKENNMRREQNRGKYQKVEKDW